MSKYVPTSKVAHFEPSLSLYHGLLTARYIVVIQRISYFQNLNHYFEKIDRITIKVKAVIKRYLLGNVEKANWRILWKQPWLKAILSFSFFFVKTLWNPFSIISWLALDLQQYFLKKCISAIYSFNFPLIWKVSILTFRCLIITNIKSMQKSHKWNQKKKLIEKQPDSI